MSRELGDSPSLNAQYVMYSSEQASLDANLIFGKEEKPFNSVIGLWIVSVFFLSSFFFPILKLQSIRYFFTWQIGNQKGEIQTEIELKMSLQYFFFHIFI